jgi:hypothetical protein
MPVTFIPSVNSLGDWLSFIYQIVTRKSWNVSVYTSEEKQKNRPNLPRT